MLKPMLLTMLTLFGGSSFADMRTITFTPNHIAIGNAGPMVLFIGANSILSGTAPNGQCDEWGRTYFYLPLSDERTKHFEAIALSAQATGKNLMIYYSDSAPQVIMQWVGLTGCQIENLRIEG
jgi:hypothetical protein